MCKSSEEEGEGVSDVNKTGKQKLRVEKEKGVCCEGHPTPY